MANVDFDLIFCYDAAMLLAIVANKHRSFVTGKSQLDLSHKKKSEVTEEWNVSGGFTVLLINYAYTGIDQLGVLVRFFAAALP